MFNNFSMELVVIWRKKLDHHINLPISVVVQFAHLNCLWPIKNLIWFPWIFILHESSRISNKCHDVTDRENAMQNAFKWNDFLKCRRPINLKENFMPFLHEIMPTVTGSSFPIIFLSVLSFVLLTFSYVLRVHVVQVRLLCIWTL